MRENTTRILEHRIPAAEVMREKEKDDHGNDQEGLAFAPNADPISPKEYVERLAYVDHTTAAKGQSKVKIFFSNFAPDVEKDYNDFCAQKGIKGQGAHDHVTRRSCELDDHSMLFTIYLYYEEVK